MILLGVGLVSLAGIALLAILAFEVWMFVDAIRNPRLTDIERVLWCVGMLLIHPFVALAYYFIEHTNRPKL